MLGLTESDAVPRLVRSSCAAQNPLPSTAVAYVQTKLCLDVVPTNLLGQCQLSCLPQAHEACLWDVLSDLVQARFIQVASNVQALCHYALGTLKGDGGWGALMPI